MGALPPLLALRLCVMSEKNVAPSLLATEALLEGLLTIIPAAILAVNEAQQILLFSREAETIFGYAKEEILGQALDVLLPVAVVEIHRKHLRAFAQAPERVRLMNMRQNVWGRRRDGSEFPAEAAIAKVQQAGQFVFVICLHDITVRLQLDEILQKNRANLHDLQEARTAKGKLSDEVLLAELEVYLRQQEALVQRNTDLGRANADLSQFASVLSHDLQEPLRLMTHYLDASARAYEAGASENARALLAEAQTRAAQMKSLIQHLLVAARNPEPTSLHPVISFETILTEVCENLKLAIHENAVRITHDALPSLPADKSQMIQLFQNLVSNAIKFRSERPPEIHISVRHLAREAPFLEDPAPAILRSQWVFCVRDNGLGIEPQNFERIFDMYQRGHPDAPAGFGMGLAIARRVVERHGGRIWVESEVGRETKFYFTLLDQSD